MRDERIYIFDCCNRYAKECRAAESGLGAITINPDKSLGGKPRVGNLRAEYLAEFDQCGKRSLFCWAPRYALFRLYYVQGMDYRDVMGLLAISKGTFDGWSYLIKQSVGPELVRRGLYPPSQYKVPSLAPDDESRYTTQLLVAEGLDA